MPKKKKAPQKDEEEGFSHEGRPAGRLTLGDFIVKKVPSKRKTETPTSDQLSKETTIESSSTSVAIADSLSLTNINETDANSLPDFKDEGGSKNALSYHVCRTKKGGIPVKVESRSSGKKVTLVEHVHGDGKLLVHNMKSKFGTGGFYKDDTIELQGDCMVKVTKYLNENKSILKPYGTK